MHQVAGHAERAAIDADILAEMNTRSSRSMAWRSPSRDSLGIG